MPLDTLYKEAFKGAFDSFLISALLSHTLHWQVVLKGCQLSGLMCVRR